MEHSKDNPDGMRHTLLPVDAQNLLRRAVATPATWYDPLARKRAVEQATARVRRTYPEYFREEL